MLTRLPLFLSILLAALSAPAAIVLGPERELAPATTSLQFDGSSPVLAASGEGFLSFWHSSQANASFYRRLDASGNALDPIGVRLPVAISPAAAAWTGSEYVLAGYDIAQARLVAMRLGGEPRVIADMQYAAEVELTFNGSVLLATWVTQSISTQTLHGVLLEPDLDVIREPFVVRTRDVSTVTMPLDHVNAPSVATNGDTFLVAWEDTLRPKSITYTTVSAAGAVAPGAGISSAGPLLQPTVIATASGFVALWHDRNAIFAHRVGAEGYGPNAPMQLLRASAIGEFAVAASGSELTVAWRSTGTPQCVATPVSARRFDAGFNPIGETRTLSATPAYALELERGLVAFVTDDCGIGGSVVQIASMAEPPTTISAFLSPSTQLDPDAATDGTSVVAVWTERREHDEAAHIYGAVLDADGNVQRALDVARGEHGRIAFGGGRYLIAWTEGSMISARFLDGEPFTFAAASAFELAWTGERFVFVWTEGTRLRSAFVSSAGFVTTGPTLEEAGSLGGITAGPHGEIAALYRRETAQELQVRVATLRGEWHVEETLAAAARPCWSVKHCLNYQLLAIGWNGSDYLTVWRMSEGVPLGAFIESRLLRGPTHRLGYSYSSFAVAMGGELAWTGSSFLLALQVPALEASWPLAYAARLTATGAPLDSLTRVSESENGSPPALALLRPDRAIVLYNRRIGLTQRVAARALTIATTPRRRSARH